MLKSFTCARTQIPIVADRYAGGVDLAHVHLADADGNILATGRYDGFGRLLHDGGFRDLDAADVRKALAAGSRRLFLVGMMSRPASDPSGISRPDPGLGRFHDQRVLEAAVAAGGFASHFGLLLAYRRLATTALALEVTCGAGLVAEMIGDEVRSGFDRVYRDEAAGRLIELPEPGFFGEGIVVVVRPSDRDGTTSTFSLDRNRSSIAPAEAHREQGGWVGLGPSGFARIWALSSARPVASRTVHVGRSTLRSMQNELGGAWTELDDGYGARAFRNDAAALAAIGFADGRWSDGRLDAGLREFFAHGMGVAEFVRPSAPQFR